MDDERRKAILLALACLAILILLIIECAIMPRMGWLWIITAALDLVLLAMCVRHIICFASMFVRQVRQCFSAVWADGFPRCRHRFPVM